MYLHYLNTVFTFSTMHRLERGNLREKVGDEEDLVILRLILKGTSKLLLEH